MVKFTSTHNIETGEKLDLVVLVLNNDDVMVLHNLLTKFKTWFLYEGQREAEFYVSLHKHIEERYMDIMSKHEPK